MQIEKLIAPDYVAAECVVVIDVLRAFTTAAFAFAAGATKVIAVSTIDEALELKKQDTEFLLMGEQHGLKIDGFDFGNSPYEIQKNDLKCRTLIQRTSAGTQGIVRAKHSKHILAASFVVAEATYQRILEINPEKVTFLITGKNQADEDMSFADYLSLKLTQKSPIDPKPFLQRVIDSPLGRQFQQMTQTTFLADLQLAIAIDLFSFSMQVNEDRSNATIYPRMMDLKMTDSNELIKKRD